MLRQKIALILVVLILITGIPVALASESFSARTPLSGADSDKLANLRLAAQAIDGTVVPAGEWFSFNETVGPREKSRGFRKAPNGRGVVVTGGGVAQAASTLYMVLLQLAKTVDIDPVKTYGNRFTDDYVQNPSLAIVTDYDAGIDLSFTNRGEDLYIDMWMDEADLWCVITVGQDVPDAATDDSGKGDDWSFLDDDDAAPNGKYPDKDVDPYETLPYDDDAFDNRPYKDVDPSEVLPGDDPYNTPPYETLPYDDDPYEGDPNESLPNEDDFFTDDYDDSPYYTKPVGNGGVSVGSSCINCGGDTDVLHNVTLAAGSLNDTTLDSGDFFSFNDVVGPRTKKYGYRRATNGRGAEVTGGGVAQVASALWLAVKNNRDVQIVEKSTYGKRYNQNYVSDPDDAILTDYASGRDFRFRYVGDTSITIYTYVEDGWLYCDVFQD